MLQMVCFSFTTLIPDYQSKTYFLLSRPTVPNRCVWSSERPPVLGRRQLAVSVPAAHGAEQVCQHEA